MRHWRFQLTERVDRSAPAFRWACPLAIGILGAVANNVQKLTD